MIRLIYFVSILASVCLSLPAAAHQQLYSTELKGSNEVPLPPNPSLGTGTATVTVDFDLVTIRIQASFSNLAGSTTASHIHCCTSVGSNAGVATQLPSFSGFPLGVTAGSYDHTFDLSLAESYSANFITNHGGTVGGAFNALIDGLDNGQAYFNIHTALFPGGEIRGQLAPIPIPAAFWMFAPALVAVMGVRRKSRSA